MVSPRLMDCQVLFFRDRWKVATQVLSAPVRWPLYGSRTWPPGSLLYQGRTSTATRGGRRGWHRAGLNGMDVIVAEALALTKQANAKRQEAITQLLRDQALIARSLQALGYQDPSNGHSAGNGKLGSKSAHVNGSHDRFKNLSIAEIGKELLRDGSSMHGSRIEAIAKEGGFKSKSEHFQSYLAVAFKRAGGFENLGGNTWKLNDSILPLQRQQDGS